MLQIVPDPDTTAKSPAKSRVPHALRQAFRAEVKRRVGDGDFAERERVALELANEAVCAELTEALEVFVDAHGDEDVLVDGVRYRLHTWGRLDYHSVVGPLSVRRPIFRKVGVRNGPTVVPLELAAGLVERATPALAGRVAMAKADGASRDLHRQLLASHRVPPSRATLEVMGSSAYSCSSSPRAAWVARCMRLRVSLSISSPAGNPAAFPRVAFSSRRPSGGLTHRATFEAPAVHQPRVQIADCAQ